MEESCLCIDVGGSSIKYAILDNTKNLSEYGKIPTPYDGVEAYLSCLTNIYKKFEGRVGGISLSVPGIIDSGNGICIMAGSLTYANGLHLVKELQERCDTPVFIMNDAKCAALAEASWGALSDVNDGVVIVFGTGVGGSFIKNGEVHMGANFSAGEFSYISMNSDLDSPDNLWWGVNGIQRLIGKAARIKNLDIIDVDGEQVFRWIEEGDNDILQLLDEFTKITARMIMNLQFIYDPERFAIGGGISRQPKLMEYIKKNLDYYYKIYPYSTAQAEVVTCKYFNEANLIGAYINFLRNKNKVELFRKESISNQVI